MFNDLDPRLREAHTRGQMVAADVIAHCGSGGPSMVLLVLRAAQAEAMRILRTQIPEDRWPQFVADQATIEAAYDRELAPVVQLANRINRRG